MTSMASVHEQVHEQAGEQERERQDAEHVGRVLCQEEEACHDQEPQQDGPRSRAKPATAAMWMRVLMKIRGAVLELIHRGSP